MTVIEFAGKAKSNAAKWLCKCECGNETIVVMDHLRNGHTQSCGCYQSDQVIKAHKKHGKTKYKSKERIYRTWAGMKSRCNNPNETGYKYYGGRGIKVCEEWQDFIPFMNWAMANGYRDDLTIDRIDNDGNYCPENCQWLTRAENARKEMEDKRRRKVA